MRNSRIMKITLLSAAVITDFGTFEYRRISLSEACEIVKSAAIESAIGHSSTAALLSSLLGVEVAANRIEHKQSAGDVALVFRLGSRIPEGKVLNREEIEAVGYELGILRRIK